jgi:NAD(P)-dependent dehydrogenase (short-subunit alcohol dehydrogenase family)
MGMERAVVVTGASTGIGRACAEALAGAGIHVFAGVRREEDAAALRTSLGAACTPLLFDVTDDAAVAAAAAKVREALGGETLFGLVNNAGMALPGPLMHQKLDEFRRQFEVNLVGALRVTQAFLPLLGARMPPPKRPGRIVNISSVTGRIAPPFAGAYSASKHALEGLSDSLRRELLLYGIDVIVIEPGAVITPIWDKAENANLSAYRGTDYWPILESAKAEFIAEGREGLPPEAIGAAVLRVLTQKHPPARRTLVRGRLLNWSLPRSLPARLLDRLIAWRIGLKPPR